MWLAHHPLRPPGVAVARSLQGHQGGSKLAELPPTGGWMVQSSELWASPGHPTAWPQLTTSSSLLACRGTTMTRKWFCCTASSPSKILRVCLPGPKEVGKAPRWERWEGWEQGVLTRLRSEPLSRKTGTAVLAVLPITWRVTEAVPQGPFLLYLVLSDPPSHPPPHLALLGARYGNSAFC